LKPRAVLILPLTLGLLAAPLAAGAQQAGKAARIGVLGAGVNPRSASFYAAFEHRLRELGYIEGQNLAIHFRTPSKGEDLLQTADALVRQRPDVLVVVGPEASMTAARRATRTIPIVMVALNYDPIALGYVESLARPGGNITGLFFRSPELAAKQLELLRDALPRAESIAMLWEAAASDQMRSAAAAAMALGVRLQTVEVRPPYDFEAAFTLVLRSRAAGVLVVGGPMFFRERGRIADLALKHRLPSMSGAFPDLRYTMGYGPSLDEALRRAGDYVDKIVKGAKPADLPVEQPTKFELVINLKTAKALGLTIPPSLLLRADQVIE
jgi:putative ABC transport system substrate-binding protein